MTVAVDRAKKMVIPGPLQLAVFACVWSRTYTSLRAIYKHVTREYKPVAYSTVAATVYRMKDRGWLVNARPGVYTAGISRDELMAIIADIIEEV